MKCNAFLFNIFYVRNIFTTFFSLLNCNFACYYMILNFVFQNSWAKGVRKNSIPETFLRNYLIVVVRVFELFFQTYMCKSAETKTIFLCFAVFAKRIKTIGRLAKQPWQIIWRCIAYRKLFCHLQCLGIYIILLDLLKSAKEILNFIIGIQTYFRYMHHTYINRALRNCK